MPTFLSGPAAACGERPQARRRSWASRWRDGAPGDENRFEKLEPGRAGQPAQVALLQAWLHETNVAVHGVQVSCHACPAHEHPACSQPVCITHMMVRWQMVLHDGGDQSAIRRGMRQSRARLSSLRVDPIEGNQAAIRRQSGARQRSLRVDPLFAERNIIKPFRQQFGVERSERGPKLHQNRGALARRLQTPARRRGQKSRFRRSFSTQPVLSKDRNLRNRMKPCKTRSPPYSARFSSARWIRGGALPSERHAPVPPTLQPLPRARVRRAHAPTDTAHNHHRAHSRSVHHRA